MSDEGKAVTVEECSKQRTQCQIQRTHNTWKLTGALIGIALAIVSWGFSQSMAQAVLETKVEDQQEDIKEILSEIKIMRASLDDINKHVYRHGGID